MRCKASLQANSNSCRLEAGSSRSSPATLGRADDSQNGLAIRSHRGQLSTLYTWWYSVHTVVCLGAYLSTASIESTAFVFCWQPIATRKGDSNGLQACSSPAANAPMQMTVKRRQTSKDNGEGHEGHWRNLRASFVPGALGSFVLRESSIAPSGGRSSSYQRRFWPTSRESCSRLELSVYSQEACIAVRVSPAIARRA